MEPGLSGGLDQGVVVSTSPERLRIMGRRTLLPMVIEISWWALLVAEGAGEASPAGVEHMRLETGGLQQVFLRRHTP